MCKHRTAWIKYSYHWPVWRYSADGFRERTTRNEFMR